MPTATNYIPFQNLSAQRAKLIPFSKYAEMIFALKGIRVLRKSDKVELERWELYAEIKHDPRSIEQVKELVHPDYIFLNKS